MKFPSIGQSHNAQNKLIQTPPYYKLEESNFNFRYSERKMIKLFAKCGDPDQMLHSAASDLCLHCLPFIL